MARSLAPDGLSLTGMGVALVTNSHGEIRPEAVEGLIVADRRAVSEWRLTATGATLRRVNWERTGPSADRLLFTVNAAETIDPVALMERKRTLTGSGFQETITITAYSAAPPWSLALTVARDDQSVFELGDTPGPPSTPLGPSAGGGTLPAQPSVDPPFDPRFEPDEAVAVSAPGWRFDDGTLTHAIDVRPGESWHTTLLITVTPATDPTTPATASPRASTTVDISTTPSALGRAVHDARLDLHALTMPAEGRSVLAAGSPFFLALFGRDSIIAGSQFLLESTGPLLGSLATLARHQARDHDPLTGAQPGRILHELRLGRVGVFGVEPGNPYYGAVDTSALFVIALGEAAAWGADRAEIASLLPAAHAALEWCARHGDVDGDGFIESVPHATGLVNLGWKDSGDSIIDATGTTIVDHVALAEVQAYWYRALRSVAGLEQWLGLGDGADALSAAGELAARFLDHFVYDTDQGPFIGLALTSEKKLLEVRTSNAGHVLWSGILPDDLAASVATQLGGSDLFSGWGVRTVGSSAAGYNPFGYHRGSVWPHDTAFAIHGAARYGQTDVVRTISDGLLALCTANGGQLPELISGIGRSDVSVPVPYTAACRPQAWAAGATLVMVRALLGLEPDVTHGVVRLRPVLPTDVEVRIRNLRLGEHAVSFTARGTDVTDVVAPTLSVITGDQAILSGTPWAAWPQTRPDPSN